MNAEYRALPTERAFARARRKLECALKLRAIDQETIARLTRENIELSKANQVVEHGPAHMARELKRAGQAIERAHADMSKIESEKHGLALRLEEERKRKEMAAICLDAPEHINGLRVRNYKRPLGLAEQIELARMVLDERELRQECEDCCGPCSVDGSTCLLCAHEQPKAADMERCPPREGEGAVIPAGRMA